MNIFQIIIDVIMVFIIALLVILGIRRGFVKSFFRSTKIIFVILITVLIGSVFVSLCQNMFVGQMFEGKISDKLVERAEKDSANFGVEQIQDELPAIVKNIIPTNEIENDFLTLSGNNVEKARAIGEKIEKTATSIVSNVLGYVIAFIVSFIVCSIGIIILEKIFSLPVLSWLNRLGGVFWGLANAYLTTSLIVCIVALVFGNDFVNGTIVTKTIYYFGLFTF